MHIQLDLLDTLDILKIDVIKEKLGDYYVSITRY
jgi:hypothetical protein